MATKLGKYTIPKDTDSKSYAGLDGSAGSSFYGLAVKMQPDFVKVVEEFISAAKDAGIAIETGQYGWISKVEAETLAQKGNSFYLSNIKIFGWGLGLYVTSISGTTSENKTAEEWISSNKSDYGLNFGMAANGGALLGYYLSPSSVKQDSDATELKYEEASSDGNSSDSASSSGSGSVASVAYFFSNAFSSYQSTSEAYMLYGQRALANDEVVWNSVKKACNASMRSCMSLADGRFCAFYPDYYGLYEGCNATPYLELDNIDLIDLKITQSDDEYYSHVFVSGVDSSGSTVDYVYTMGVVSIESDTVAQTSQAMAQDENSIVTETSDQVSAILSKLINIPEGESWKYTPKELYRRYGARPKKGYSLNTVVQLVENYSGASDSSDTKPQYIMPFLAALYEFMNHWAKQNKATLSITFQPSLFPGCRIKLKGFDISFFVESVSHSMSYSSGFTTTVNCSCPVGSLVSGMVNPS